MPLNVVGLCESFISKLTWMDDDAKWKLTGLFGEVFNGLEVSDCLNPCNQST